MRLLCETSTQNNFLRHTSYLVFVCCLTTACLSLANKVIADSEMQTMQATLSLRCNLSWSGEQQALLFLEYLVSISTRAIIANDCRLSSVSFHWTSTRHTKMPTLSAFAGSYLASTKVTSERWWWQESTGLPLFGYPVALLPNHHFHCPKLIVASSALQFSAMSDDWGTQLWRQHAIIVTFKTFQSREAVATQNHAHLFCVIQRHLWCFQACVKTFGKLGKAKHVT